MKACVIAETSAAARALCAGARGLADEVVPVSYTHLDVYKRQTWRS